MKTTLRKTFTLLLCLSLCLCLVPMTVADASNNRSYKKAILNVNWSNIQNVGHQISGGEACSCYSLAYCRTLLDSRVHQWHEYNNGTNEYFVNCIWPNGSYTSFYPPSEEKQTAFEKIYTEIVSGKPVVAKVSGSRTPHHYVAVVGFENVSKTGDLSANNFLIIDPCAPSFVLENMANVGYDLKAEYSGDTGKYHYQIVYDTSSSSVSFSETIGFSPSYLDKCTWTSCSDTIKITSSTYLKSLPCSNDTAKKYGYKSENVINSALPLGTTLKTSGLYINSEGNYWYAATIISEPNAGASGYIYQGDSRVLYVPQFDTYAIEEITVDNIKAGVWLDNPQGKTLNSIGIQCGTDKSTAVEKTITQNVAWTRSHLLYDISNCYEVTFCQW